MAWNVIARSQGCDPCYDGKCPTIWQDPETGRVRVRGYTSGWLRWLRRELDVEYSAEEWAFLVAQLPR